jgi:hypothetical protein
MGSCYKQLQDVSQRHAEWAAAIILSTQLYDGKSLLHLHELTIHPAFKEGLNLENNKSALNVAQLA